MDFSLSAAELERRIRGLYSWPSAYTYLDGKLLKILSADVVERTYDALPGTVAESDADSFVIAAGDGGLRVLRVQLEGKKAMNTDAFLRGHALKTGTRVGRTA
ncbi:MAG: hypothetical protein ILO68_03475 [Clostridia bacterium]|nr:hypothetical protein [Clostridia bacterium]